MTARDDFDRHLAAWLAADAPMHEPEPLLGQVLARTARTRRRPAWRIPERWIPMSAITTRAAPVSRFPLRSVGVVALLVLVLAVAAVLYVGGQRPRLPAPFGPAANGQLLFSRDGDLFLADSITALPRSIVAGATKDVGPGYSYDGARFLFLRMVEGSGQESVDLWVADDGGSDAHRLAGPFDQVGWYDWSPTGDVIAVSSVIDGRPTVTLVRTDGSGSSVLDLGGRPAEAAQWRPPDGRQLLVRSVDGPRTALYLANRDGSTPTRLGLDASLPAGAVPDEYSYMAPSWSPDGTRIVFDSPQPDPTSHEGPGLQVHMATIGPAGQVLGDLVLSHAPEQSDHNAIFVPQGDRIVFLRNQSGVQKLFIVPIAAAFGAPQDLQCCEGIDQVALAPDGDSVLLTSGSSGALSRLDLSNLHATSGDLVTDDTFSWQRRAP